VYLQAGYPFDEARESHVMIQHRVVLENLDAITRVLFALTNGSATPWQLPGKDRQYGGQPWLTAYLHWKRGIRRAPT
jgi:hypothetical protein